jgi:predicted GIY-YIG superfamily endonuclease
MEYFVYVIGLKEDFSDPYHNCYVGVTKDLLRRWDEHLKSKYTVGKFINYFDLKFEENMIEIFKGTKEQCFALENKLRPRPFMGLNEAVGGFGEYTSCYDNSERNNKISQALKGVSKTAEHTEKMRKTIVERGIHRGSKNTKAKKWVLTNPDGMIYYIHGNLNETCNSLNLLCSTLRYYKNQVVPEVNTNVYGGYRAKSEESFKMRMNTTGWALSEAQSRSGGV